MNDYKYDEEADSNAPTLRCPPRISQRPTIKVPSEKSVKNISIKYKFYLIGIIIVTIIITSIIFISKPSQSQVMYEHRIYNLAPIIIPNDNIKVTPQTILPIPSSSNEIKQKIPKIIPKSNQIKYPKIKDYGI